MNKFQLFTKLKHWQIFALQNVLPIIFLLILIMIFVKIHHRVAIVLGFFGLIFIQGSLFMCWVFSIGILFRDRINITTDSPLNVKKFKRSFLVVLVYFGLLLSLMVVGFMIPEIINKYVIGLISTFTSLYAMYCMIYCINFSAKALKTYELGRIATLGDYLVEILLFIYFPIGVWLIQPKVNKVYLEHNLITNSELD